jgi:N-methylhydantoinase A
VHERVFAVSEPGQQVECIYWKARATALLPKPVRESPTRAEGEAKPSSLCQAWFSATTPQMTPRYHGPDMPLGCTIAGPCIIQEPTTTIVVFPGWDVTVTSSGDYMMHRPQHGA